MKIIRLVGFAVLSTALTSSAFAGCGKASAFNFPTMSAEQRSMSTPSRLDDDRNLPGRSDITGLWLSTVTVSGQTAFQSFEAFTQDGLEILNDNGPTLEGNVCLGAWTANGSTVKVYHPSWSYDSAGNLIGTVIIREQVTLDPSGNTFKGTVSAEAFDLSGHSLGIVLQGTLTGKRITG